MANERIEAEMTVPASTTVSASNSGGGATTVTLTPGATFLTTLCSDFATALTAQRAPSSGAWTCSFSPSTGLVAIGCDNSTTAVPSFSLDWASTALRDVLGFEYNINYPTTAAELLRQLGYGTWTTGAGYLFNEASGNLSSSFGSPATLTATSLTYGTSGPRGGADKAIGFDAGTDNASGGDVFDITATDDFICLWVGYNSAAPAGASDFIVTKYNSGVNGGWNIQMAQTTALIQFQGVDTGASQLFITSGVSGYVGEWHIGIATIDRSTGKARCGTYGLTSASASVSSESTVAATTMANAHNFQIGDQSGGGGFAPQSMKLAALYVVSGSGVATGLSANLSTALSNFAAQFGTWTGTVAPSGLFLPNAPYVADTDPKQAPTVDDRATSISPTCRVYSIATESIGYRHRAARFPFVAQSRVWENSASTSGLTWETFYLETQLGQHSWFEVGSRVKVYWDNAGVVTQVGNGDVEAWRMPECVKLDELGLTGSWTGLVDIRLGDLFADPDE